LLSAEACALACVADVLAGKPAADEVNSFKFLAYLSHVRVLGNVRPVLL
jgi:hypothetical protein